MGEKWERNASKLSLPALIGVTLQTVQQKPQEDKSLHLSTGRVKGSTKQSSVSGLDENKLGRMRRSWLESLL